MNCFKCGVPLPDLYPEENQPMGGTEFHTYGHYGSAVTDLMGSAKHILNVCDPCVVDGLKNNLVKRIDRKLND